MLSLPRIALNPAVCRRAVPPTVAAPCARVNARGLSVRLEPLRRWLGRHAFLAGDLLDQIDERAAEIGVLDIAVSAQKTECAGYGQELERRFFAFVLTLALEHFLAVEERADIDAEHLGNLGQTTGADAIDALLVLLHLLKCHAQPVGKRRLREAARQPLDSDPRSEERRVGKECRSRWSPY